MDYTGSSTAVQGDHSSLVQLSSAQCSKASAAINSTQVVFLRMYDLEFGESQHPLLYTPHTLPLLYTSHTLPLLYTSHTLPLLYIHFTHTASPVHSTHTAHACTYYVYMDAMLQIRGRKFGLGKGRVGEISTHPPPILGW